MYILPTFLTYIISIDAQELDGGVGNNTVDSQDPS